MSPPFFLGSGVCRLGHNGFMTMELPLPHLAHRNAAALALVARVGMLASMLGALPAAAQDIKPVYRCPGPPVLYTDAISVAEARERGCRGIEGAPITIVQGRPPARTASGGAGGAGGVAGPAAASRPGDRIDPAAQRARDSDARRILADELKREEERLAVLQKDFNNGEPERRGDERNFQKYQERVADMRAGIQRKEADIAALKREMAKLPQ